jgi:sensor histidine kinase YesM/ligand-binding sensor domain-containing protein
MLQAKKHILSCLLLIISSLIYAQSIEFKNISTKEGLPQSDVFDAIQDDVGYIWFATQGGGIAKYDGKEFIVYNQNKGLLSNFTNHLFLKKDSLFIGTNKGLSILYKEKFSNYSSPRINSIHQLNDETYLATQQGISIFKKDYIAPIKINLKIDLSSIIRVDYFASYYWIQTQSQLWKTRTLKNPKSIVKASRNETISFFKKHNNLLNQYQKHAALKATKLIKVYIDKQQNSWLLTEGNGVYKSIATSFQHYANADAKPIGQITAIHSTNQTVWFSDANHLFKNDSTGIHNLSTLNHQFKITSITTDKEKNLWIGSKNKGIYIFRKQTDSLNIDHYKIERLYTQNGFPNNRIQKIHIQNDTVWVVTKNVGIIKLDYDFENGFVKKIRRFNRNNGLKEHAITTSLLHDNMIWYGTKNGALGFIKNNSVTHYSNVIKQNTSINSLAFNNKNLYLGSLGNGIWSAKSNQINKLKSLNNSYLSSLNVYQLLFDENNNLWVGSEKGLDKLELQNTAILKATHYNVNDGFTGIETSLNTAVEAFDTNLWFGTKNGITKYTPSNNNPLKKKPTIYFENIEIDYQSIDSLNNAIISNSIQLKPGQNNLSFTYKTIDLTHPDRIEYQWKLNEDVGDWTTSNSINFPNLKSDDYIFRVTSRNAYKLESQPKVFHFYIDKPIYEKAWFIAGVIGLFVFILLLIISSYIEKINKKNKAEVKKLTLEKHLISLEQKALQLQMNPHFIFNVLNGIKALGNNGNTEELNTTISQFATLLRAILNNSREEEISLSQEINTLKNYLELEQKMSSNPFHYTFNTNTNNIDLEEILIPPMLMQPFIENCIKHGFKGKSEAGKISINFTVKNNFLYCAIVDNGVGYKHSQKTTNNHKSVALKVTKERIENLSKYSSFDISEVQEKNQVTGTKVEFKIPLKTDY